MKRTGTYLNLSISRIYEQNKSEALGRREIEEIYGDAVLKAYNYFGKRLLNIISDAHREGS